MPYVSYSLANMIINAFKKSNEVFTISYLHFAGLLKFPTIGNGKGGSREVKELRGEEQRSSFPQYPPPGPGPFLRAGGMSDNPGKLRLKFLKSAGSTSKKGKEQERGRRNEKIAIDRSPRRGTAASFPLRSVTSPRPSRAGVHRSPR